MQENVLLCQGTHPFVSCGTKIVITWVFCYFFKKQPFYYLFLIIYKSIEIIFQISVFTPQIKKKKFCPLIGRTTKKEKTPSEMKGSPVPK